MFSLTDDISVFDVESVDEKTVWNTLFADMELISERRLGEDSEIWEFTLRENGMDCTGQLYEEGGIEFSGLSERVSTLYPEKLMAELSVFTGMDWILDKAEDEDETVNYQFSVDGIDVYPDGYAIREEELWLDFICGIH